MNIKSLRSLYIRAQLQLKEAEDYENNVPITAEIYHRMVARYQQRVINIQQSIDTHIQDLIEITDYGIERSPLPENGEN